MIFREMRDCYFILITTSPPEKPSSLDDDKDNQIHGDDASLSDLDERLLFAHVDGHKRLSGEH